MIKAEVQKSPIVRFDSKYKTYRWGTKNDFPNALLKIIGYSGLASQCLDVTALYLMGEGVKVTKDTAPNARLDAILKHVNRDVMPELCRNFALIPALVTNVQHNALGEVKKLVPMDNTAFRFMEMTEPNKFSGVAFSGDWKNANEIFNAQYPERLLTKYPIWEGKEEAKAAMEMDVAKNGHIYIETMLRPGDNIYPTPAWFGGANVVYLDGQIMVWQIDNIDNNFNADFIVLVNGDLSGVDENGVALVEKYKADFRRRFSGTSDQGGKGDRFVLMGVPTDAKVPFEIKPIPNSGSDKMFTELYDKVHQSLTEAFGVPMALINGAQKSSLGSRELLNAAALFNNQLLPKQKAICYYIERIVKDFEGMGGVEFELEITPNIPVAEVPDLVYDRMNDATLFDYFGINTIGNEQPTNNI